MKNAKKDEKGASLPPSYGQSSWENELNIAKPKDLRIGPPWTAKYAKTRTGKSPTINEFGKLQVVLDFKPLCSCVTFMVNKPGAPPKSTS